MTRIWQWIRWENNDKWSHSFEGCFLAVRTNHSLTSPLPNSKWRKDVNFHTKKNVDWNSDLMPQIDRPSNFVSECKKSLQNISLCSEKRTKMPENSKEWPFVAETSSRNFDLVQYIDSLSNFVARYKSLSWRISLCGRNGEKWPKAVENGRCSSDRSCCGSYLMP